MVGENKFSSKMSVLTGLKRQDIRNTYNYRITFLDPDLSTANQKAETV